MSNSVSGYEDSLGAWIISGAPKEPSLEFEPIQKQVNKKKALCLSLQLGCLGTRRSISSDIVDSEADKSLVHVSKDILESKELRDIKSIDSEIRTYLRHRSLPTMFKRGFYLLPLTLIEEVDSKIEEFASRREKLVSTFIEAYPARKAEAEKRLKDLYRDHDYPPLKLLNGVFYMKHQYVSFGAPDDLTSISKEIFDKEAKKAAAHWAEALDDIRDGLRQGFSDLINHFVDRLGNKEDGKPKKFHASVVENMQGFLDLFEAKNISDDVELEVLVGKVRQLVKNTDPSQIRSDATLRTSVLEGVSQIKETLDSMLVDKPNRKYFIDEELEESIDAAA